MRFELVMYIGNQLCESIIHDDKDLVSLYLGCFDDEGNLVKDTIITKQNVIKVRSIYRISKKEENND